MIEPAKKDLHNVMADKLTAADATFKDSINRLVNSQVCDNKTITHGKKHSKSDIIQSCPHRQNFKLCYFLIVLYLKSWFVSVVMCFKTMLRSVV